MKTTLHHEITVNLQLSRDEAEWLLHYLEYYPRDQQFLSEFQKKRHTELRVLLSTSLDRIQNTTMPFEE